MFFIQLQVGRYVIKEFLVLQSVYRLEFNRKFRLWLVRSLVVRSFLWYSLGGDVVVKRGFLYQSQGWMVVGRVLGFIVLDKVSVYLGFFRNQCLGSFVLESIRMVLGFKMIVFESVFGVLVYVQKSF